MKKFIIPATITAALGTVVAIAAVFRRKTANI